MPHSMPPRGASSVTCLSTSTTRRRRDGQRIHAAETGMRQPIRRSGSLEFLGSLNVQRQRAAYAMPSKICRTTVLLLVYAPTAGLAEPQPILAHGCFT